MRRYVPEQANFMHQSLRLLEKLGNASFNSSSRRSFPVHTLPKPRRVDDFRMTVDTLYPNSQIIPVVSPISDATKPRRGDTFSKSRPFQRILTWESTLPQGSYRPTEIHQSYCRILSCQFTKPQLRLSVLKKIHSRLSKQQTACVIFFSSQIESDSTDHTNLVYVFNPVYSDLDVMKETVTNYADGRLSSAHSATSSSMCLEKRRSGQISSQGGILKALVNPLLKQHFTWPDVTKIKVAQKQPISDADTSILEFNVNRKIQTKKFHRVRILGLNDLRI